MCTCVRVCVCVCVCIFTHGDFFSLLYLMLNVMNLSGIVLHCVQVLCVFCKSSQFCNKFSNIEAAFTVFGIPV